MSPGNRPSAAVAPPEPPPIGTANLAVPGVDGQSLTDLMNRYVFNYSGAPLKGLTADVSATPDGWIRIHPIKIRICNLNGAVLMKASASRCRKC